jgi:two-component system, OmpR family, heavy metal sensor histidine kinase CusS
MCSKTQRREVGPGVRRTSIAARLTWLYVGTTAALLLLAELFLYWGLVQSLRTRDEQLLASKVRVLRVLLRDPTKADALESEIEHEAGEDHALKYYMRILMPDGTTLLETPGMAALLPADVFPTSVYRSHWRPTAFKDYDAPTGEEYLLLVASAVAGPAGAESRKLQLAVDTSLNRALLSENRRRLLVVFALGVLFAAAAGVVVTRKGLQPLAEIAAKTRRISASKLHERLAPDTWPAELRALAGEFDAMLDRLEDSFARLSQCSADLAHELRTPINNLRGEAEVTLTRARTPPEYQQVLSSSLEECDRLARLIDGVLFIARADHPDTAVERLPLRVREEMEAVREFFSAVANERKVTVSCAGDGVIRGDAMLFRRALGNLLGNALRHTPGGGSVTLAACTTAEGAVAVSVKDTGEGIAPKHLPRAFDRFYRPDRSRPHGEGGAGLGLAIVHSIMRLHGGSASIQSEVEEGTTVTLRFPAPADGEVGPAMHRVENPAGM